MNELDGDRAFTNTRRYTLHRTAPYITHREYSRHIGFEQTRIAVESPRSGTAAVSDQVRSREDEATLVPLQDTFEPVGPGNCADKDEQSRRGHAIHLTAIAAANGNRLETIFTVYLD